MKATRMHRSGPPDVLVYEDAPEPVLRADEALVRVRACAMNHLDVWVRSGLRRSEPLKEPFVLGCDVAGEVAAVGELVTWARPGEPVMVIPNLSCGHCRDCLSGRDNYCRQFHILGAGRNGGYAEYVAVPGKNLVAKPEHLGWEEAAAIPLVFLTAWNMLVTNARIQPGEEVLVVGAGSGVGSAAIQVCKLFGCRVIATAGSDEKLERARALGADAGINHATQDIAEEARRLTGKRGVDIVFEHVGQATWDKSIRALASGGRLVTCGATTGAQGTTDIRHVFARHLSIHGTYMGGSGEFHEMMCHVRAGRLRGVVGQTFALKDAAEAHRTMESRSFFGKLVLVP